MTGGLSQLLGSPITMLVLIFVLFYVLIILPQKKKQKQLREMINQLKKGDKVYTQGGIVGTVASVSDDEIQLKVGDNCKISFLKQAIIAKKEDKPVAK